MNTNAHPDRDELLAYAQGRLEDRRNSEVEQHVAECDSCCRILTAVGEDAPDDLLNRVRGVETMTDSQRLQSTVAEWQPQGGMMVPPELANHPRYRIMRQLGSGGMGVVYHAEHRLMEREVALKVINARLVSNEQAVQRFRREWRAAAKLSHRNIVAAYDADTAGDLHFLVMEYVDGIDLAKLVASRGPQSIRRACHYACQTALGLDHAHQAGMVHRDIKPQNLIVTPQGRVKILDFGLARLEAAGSEVEQSAIPPGQGLTQFGIMLGTPDYIAPEQATDSRSADIRSDIFSLGCTLYFLLTGKPPVRQATGNTFAQPIDLNHIDNRIPAALREILKRMLDTQPSKRYQTPAEVLQVLEPFAEREFDDPIHVAAANAAALDERANDAIRDDPIPANAMALDPTFVENRSGDTTNSAPLSGRTPAESIVPSPTPAKGPFLTTRQGVAIGAGVILAIVVIAAIVTSDDGGGSKKSQEPQAGGGVQPSKASSANAPSGESWAHVLMVLPHDHFWALDYVPVRKQLEKAGVRVSVASSQSSPANPSQTTDVAAPVDLLLRDAAPTEIDAAIFVGTQQNFRNEFAANGSHHSDARQFVRKMLENKRQVTALCGGVAVLGDTGVLQGLPVANNEFLTDEVRGRSRAAKWIDEPYVESSANVFTGGSFKQAPAFTTGLLNRLHRIAKSKQSR